MGCECASYTVSCPSANNAHRSPWAILDAARRVFVTASGKPYNVEQWNKTVRELADLFRRMRDTGRFPENPGRRGNLTPANFGFSMGGGQTVSLYLF